MTLNLYREKLTGWAFFLVATTLVHSQNTRKQTGEKLSIMRGEVGVCLQGTHPDLVEKTERDSNLAKTIHSSVIKYEVYFLLLDSHPEFQPDGIELLTQADINEKHASYRIKTTVVESLTGGKSDWETILEQKSLHTVEGVVVVHVVQSGTVIRSTEEGQELKMIQENLEYDGVKQCWPTSYPWLVDSATLPDNYGNALAT